MGDGTRDVPETAAEGPGGVVEERPFMEEVQEGGSGCRSSWWRRLLFGSWGAYCRPDRGMRTTVDIPRKVLCDTTSR